MCESCLSIALLDLFSFIWRNTSCFLLTDLLFLNLCYKKGRCLDAQMVNTRAFCKLPCKCLQEKSALGCLSTPAAQALTLRAWAFRPAACHSLPLSFLIVCCRDKFSFALFIFLLICPSFPFPLIITSARPPAFHLHVRLAASSWLQSFTFYPAFPCSTDFRSALISLSLTLYLFVNLLVLHWFWSLQCLKHYFMFLQFYF